MSVIPLRFPCGTNIHTLSIETNPRYREDPPQGLWTASVGNEHSETDRVLEAFGQGSHCHRAVDVLNRASPGVAAFATDDHVLKRRVAGALQELLDTPGGIEALALCVIWTARGGTDDPRGVVFNDQVDHACYFALESGEAMTPEQDAWKAMLTSAPIVLGRDLMRSVPTEWHALSPDMTVWAWDWWSEWGWTPATALPLWQELTRSD